MATRVLIVASSAQRRRELEKMLRSAPMMRVVGVLPAIAGASAYLEHWHPDVVLIEVDLNRQNLQPLMTMLSGSFSGLAVVVLADHPQPGWTTRMLRSGVASILQRDSSPEQITAALRAAAEELIILGRDAAEEIFAPTRPSAAGKHLPDDEEDALRGVGPLVEELTRREREVLRMVAEGLGNREIASRLGISGHTIKFHISAILGKLGVSSRTEAVTQGIKRGLVLL